MRPGFAGPWAELDRASLIRRLKGNELIGVVERHKQRTQIRPSETQVGRVAPRNGNRIELRASGRENTDARRAEMGHVQIAVDVTRHAVGALRLDPILMRQLSEDLRFS